MILLAARETPEESPRDFYELFFCVSGITEKAMAQVIFETPGQMNLLGYFLRSLVERNLKSERGARAFSAISGSISVGASDMRVTLKFTADGLTIALGGERADACVSGSLDALLAVALGRELFAPVISGRLKIGGKIWRLLPLLLFFRAESKP